MKMMFQYLKCHNCGRLIGGLSFEKGIRAEFDTETPFNPVNEIAYAKTVYTKIYCYNCFTKKERKWDCED